MSEVLSEHRIYCKRKSENHPLGCSIHDAGCVAPHENHDFCPKSTVQEMKEPRVIQILQECVDVYRAKSSDYNHPTRGGEDALANFRVSKELAVQPYLGALIRLMDKVERVKTLVYKKTVSNAGPAVKDESFKDTLRDMINYSAIVLALYEEEEANGQNTSSQ